MPTVEGPFRLAVADDEDAGCGHDRASPEEQLESSSRA
jgi:hypothetical protein